MTDDPQQPVAAAPPAPSGVQDGAPVLQITPDMFAVEPPRETRVDFERGMSYAPLFSIALIVVCTLVFIWELAVGALDSQSAIIAAGALHRDSMLQGEIWRALSAMFLHGNIAHLVGNALMLYILGMAAEHALGRTQAAVLYLSAGVCGAVLSVIASPGPSVGASGAIFGLMGGVIVFLYRHQNLFYVRDKRISFALLAWSLFQISLGFLDPSIDNFCHIGGFAGGAMIVLLLKPRAGLGHASGFDVLPIRA